MRTFIILVLCLCVVTDARAQIKIGTVDMDSVFKSYSKRKEAEAKIGEATNAAKKEFEERAGAYKSLLDEINKLSAQLDAPALSAEAKTLKAKERDEKIAKIKNMEREISEFRQTREQQLRQQTSRVRETLLNEITDVVLERVKSHNLDLVFDKSGASTNGFSPLLFAGNATDLTADVISVLSKTTGAAAQAISIPAGATLSSPSPAPSAKPR